VILSFRRSDQNRLSDGKENEHGAEKCHFIVTPAEAGAQKELKKLDSCFRRNDKAR
jgi:hypothetical protein